MIEQAVLVIATQQQRTRVIAVACVSKAADDAVRGAKVFNLQHGALAGLVRAVEGHAGPSEPSLSRREIIGPG